MYKNDYIRTFKVTLPSVSDVHWLFHKKKNIVSVAEFSSISMPSDMTNKQINYKNKILNELKFRKNQGENNLYMKYVKVIPTILYEDDDPT